MHKCICENPLHSHESHNVVVLFSIFSLYFVYHIGLSNPIGMLKSIQFIHFVRNDLYTGWVTMTHTLLQEFVYFLCLMKLREKKNKYRWLNQVSHTSTIITNNIKRMTKSNTALTMHTTHALNATTLNQHRDLYFCCYNIIPFFSSLSRFLPSYVFTIKWYINVVCVYDMNFFSPFLVIGRKTITVTAFRWRFQNNFHSRCRLQLI